MSYPEWSLFPRHLSAPPWVEEFVQIVQKNQPIINSYEHNKFDSDEVLKALEQDLENKGWQVETGKKDKQKIFRPVLYGDGGKTRVSYEIDGWNPEHKIVLEVESGRGWQGNARPAYPPPRVTNP